MDDMELYSHYFPVGKKIGVGIPLPDAGLFKDWAIIHEIDEDLVSLQLSRDILPAEVSLHYGQILELRGGNEGNGYCCRAIVVSEGDSRELLLRLIGEIVSDELREFYRIDAFLPIKYLLSEEQHIDKLREEWEERRGKRHQLELEQLEQPWSNVKTSAFENRANDSWDAIIPLAANISGGGLRTVTHHGFEDGEYVLLEILIPYPKKVIDVIGKIVFANRNYAAGSDHEYFNIGVQFIFIDERDRDAIINYISSIQLKRIRQLRERYLYRGGVDYAEKTGLNGSNKVQKTTVQIILATLLLIILTVFIYLLWNYSNNHPKGEIQKDFESEVKKYREQLKQ